MKDSTNVVRDELRSSDQHANINFPKMPQDRTEAGRISRSSESRPSTTALSPVGPIRMGGRYSSLNALYEPMFKPYSFSHMYDTKYRSDFQGRYRPPASPERAETANFAAIKYRFGTTTYQQHYQNMEPITGAFVVPYSRHRKNKPQPNMKNAYYYPDQPRWIWSSPSKLPEGNNPAPPRTGQTGYPGPQPRLRFHRWSSR